MTLPTNTRVVLVTGAAGFIGYHLAARLLAEEDTVVGFDNLNDFRLPTTGVRFFTVYGPWGRPDMAMFLFTRAILEGRPIDVFNDGRMERDFTYVDDIVEGLVRLSRRPAAPDASWNGAEPTPSTSNAPYRIYNIGNNEPVRLLRMIEILEDCIGHKAEKRFLPIQPGDVPATYADIDDLKRDVGFEPTTPIEVGVERFVRWYRDYHRV